MNALTSTDVLARTIWITIKDAPQYEINEYGVVRRRIAGKGSPVGKILRQTMHSCGYPRCKLTIDGKHKTFEVHRLVIEAFKSPPPFHGAEVAHLDGNPQNNHYSNLEWKTRRENEADKKLHGTDPSGERNAAAKLNTYDVKSIRCFAGFESRRATSARFGIVPQTVWKIQKNIAWKHVH